MLLAFSIVDFATLGFCLALLLVIGSYFSSQQTSSREFMLARRSFGWLPTGLSLAATTLPAVGLLAFPGVAYGAGFKPIVFAISAWLTAMIVIPVLLPLLRELEVASIYEYLELRFNLGVRRTAFFVFVVWRLLLAACILYLPCHVLGIVFQSEMASGAFLLIGGSLATFYVYLGGLRAVVWTDVAGVGLLALVLIIAMFCGWSQVDQGQAGVWEIAEQLQRSSAVELAIPAGSNWRAEPWLFWIALPASLVCLLSFYLADQATALRMLAVRDAAEGKRGFVANCVAATVLIPLACYLGLCMLAFYQQHPENMHAYWLVNASVDQDGKLLKDPQTGVERIRPDTDFAQELDELIATGAILDPNTNEPATDASLFRDLSGNLDPMRLATIDPIPNTPAAEVRLRRGQYGLLPAYLQAILPPGILGLACGAMLIVAFAGFDSIVHAAGSLAYSELYERMGWGHSALAKYRGKQPQRLDASDELWLVRALALLAGGTTTLIAFALLLASDKSPLLLGMVTTLGGPLLAVFLLGIFTRGTTASAAQLALILGTLLALVLAISNAAEKSLGGSPGVVPIWTILVSFSTTLVVGFLASFALGRRRSRDELRGLVYGLGKLGVRPDAIEEAIDEESSTPSARWR